MEEKDLGPRSSKKSGNNSSSYTELTGVKLGQKHQVTVRLESATLETIEEIQKSNGFSFAEATRKIIQRGISDIYE